MGVLTLELGNSFQVLESPHVLAALCSLQAVSGFVVLDDFESMCLL